MTVIPRRLRRRPLDARGFVIPWIQFIADDGSPKFAVLDHNKTLDCVRGRRCGLCGEPMGKHIYFIGGPLAVANRLFYDPAMHRDCAIYALETCPHLARSKGRYGPVPEIPGAKVTVGEMIVTTKADYFALMHTTRYEVGIAPAGMVMIHAARWRDVEYWKEGKSIGATPPASEVTP